MQYKNLIIIGTSHISKQSINKVKQTLLKTKPDIIAIELDKKRFLSLIQNKKLNLKDIKHLGLKIFLLNALGSYIQKKLGKIVQTEPGSDMKTAIQIAKKINAKIALIDQPVDITLKKLTKTPLKEKLRFVKDILRDIFIKKQRIEFDLTKVPSQSLINKLIKKLKKDYPYIYQVLIKERNQIMAKNLYNLMLNNKSVVAIVGAGHKKEILNLIKCHNSQK